MNPRTGLLCFAVVAVASMLAGCSSPDSNTSLYSVRQPEVQRTTHVLDLALAGGTLSPREQARLADWFSELELGYGDQVSLMGDLRPRAAVAALAERHAVLLSDAVVMPGSDPGPGQLRIVVQRSRATVPGCPDWSANSTANLDNSTSPGFGCAVNGNLAAMIADPEHLLAGAEADGATVIGSATKAIASYRASEPTGVQGLAAVSSRGSGDE